MLGQFPPARHLIAHVSDPQLGRERLVYRGVDGDASLAATMAAVVAHKPDLIVMTGDVADTGDAEAYDRVADLVLGPAGSVGAEVVWVMGNHDHRERFAARLLDETTAPDEPLDRVHWLGGLRIVALDTTTPGYHDGRLEPQQLQWLADQLAEPAPEGTILAMHHPPIPTHLPLMALIELGDQHLLAEVVRGTDVRGILAGHYHYSAHTTLAGIPVSVAPSTCYGIDAGFDPRAVRGVDDLRGFDLVHVHDDRIVHSTVHVKRDDAAWREVSGYPVEALAFVEDVPTADHRETFARIGGLADEFEAGVSDATAP